jgi:myosin tail region-interacting protein MTI1
MSSHPFKVKAVFEYNSGIDEDLNFSEGQIITVTEDDEEDWYTGEYVDGTGVKREGLFPRNFVEKYEPTAPPRPTRAPRLKKDVEPSPVAVSEPISQPPAKREPPREQQREEIRERSINATAPQPAPPVLETAPSAAAPPTQSLPVTSPPLPKPAPASKPSAPPPVSEKPSGGSFRDRIAAFNKSAAPPPAPFKPGGLGSSGSSFIKKPFVAPPPSKDAYIPPPREPAPQKIYRREEDPEIAAKEAENLGNAERAGLAPTANEGDGDDQPKPTSLKERIALLQKQQMEQAARHADAAQKKEKSKRPPKKRTESHNMDDEQEEGEEAPLERQDSYGTVGKKSMESGHDEPSVSRAVPTRKVSKGPSAIPAMPRESYGDGNDADMSGAGDETEEPEESTGRDDSDERPKARATAHKPDVHEDEEDDADNKEEAAEEDEEEEEDVDPEVRRKEELRARMAKMSGGMGMMGMFGGGMPMPGPALPTRKKPSGTTEKKQSNEYAREDITLASGHAPPVPSIPLPGLARMKNSEETNKQLEAEHEDEIQYGSITETRPAYEVPDVEDVTYAPSAPPTRTKSERPQGMHTFICVSKSTMLTSRTTASNRDSYAAPPIPGGRPAPPPVPSECRLISFT